MTCNAGAANLTRRRGATIDVTFTYKEKDTGAVIPLTGLKARGQIRTGDGKATLVMDMASTGGAPRLIIDGAAGTVRMLISAVDTVGLSADLHNPRDLIYGIELYNDLVSPEYVEDFVAGRLTVLPEIVR